MSETRTHPGGSTRDAQEGNVYVLSFILGLFHIQSHFLSLVSKPGVSLIDTQSGKTLSTRYQDLLLFLHISLV